MGVCVYGCVWASLLLACACVFGDGLAYRPEAFVSHSLAWKHARGHIHTRRAALSLENAETFRDVLAMAVANPWSVVRESDISAQDLASQFFALSLFPYVVFLYFLSRKPTNTPPLALFGFYFLLVFVFATIPAGIYSKVHFHTILANVDWLHGSAESLLTITNLFITLGFRRALGEPSDNSPNRNPSPTELLSSGLGLALALGLALPSLGWPGLQEPTNALSLPTWGIHTSSVLEWLYAMGLIWQYASVSDNPKWKRLTWAMIPLHTSGLSACTYHIFYNQPACDWLVALQASLTCIGNCGLAYAAYTIYSSAVEENSKPNPNPKLSSTPKQEPLPDETSFLMKLFWLSMSSGAAIKWGEVAIGVPGLTPSPLLPLSLILLPTALNIWTWKSVSDNPNHNPNT